MLSRKRVRELFDYDPRGGLVVKRYRHGSHYKTGHLLMATQSDAYFRMSVDGQMYLLHRLIYLWHHGSMPDCLDHINADPRDNRIENLRIASRALNNRNVRKRRVGKSKFKGVSRTGKCRWRATIACDGKQKHLGYYDTENEAALAYNMAAVALHGEFACLNTGVTA